jgi:hypothetical protein
MFSIGRKIRSSEQIFQRDETISELFKGVNNEIE